MSGRNGNGGANSGRKRAGRSKSRQPRSNSRGGGGSAQQPQQQPKKKNTPPQQAGADGADFNPAGYNRHSVIHRGFSQLSVHKGVSDTTPPVNFKRVIGAWPISRVAGEDGKTPTQVAYISPLAIGFTDYSKFDVTVSNLGPESDVMVEFITADGDVGYETVLLHSQLPRDLSTGDYEAIRVSALSGKLAVYVNIFGWTKNYTVCDEGCELPPDMDVASPVRGASRSRSVPPMK